MAVYSVPGSGWKRLQRTLDGNTRILMSTERDRTCDGDRAKKTGKETMSS